MIFDITDIADEGFLDKERVVLKAKADGDLGDFAIFRANSPPAESEKVFSGDIPDVFWFPSLKVKNKDLVVLYTKAGKRSQKSLSNGAITYFFYWGKKSPLWNDGEHLAAIVNTEEWNFFRKNSPTE
jgi:hypothetical protein